MRTDVTDEVTDLLQHLIRNACVNDGSPASGQEVRSVDVLQSYLGQSGLDVDVYEPQPGRSSLVARIEGSDPAAPTVMLMGHTDVVPANPDGWQRDPFGGELVDGEVWGRGAVDMLNLTASMAVATKQLAQDGFRPKGTLIYLAVADEEALGDHGAGWLTEHEADAMAADYVITESGGIPMPTASGNKLPVIVGEKGTHWVRLKVKGTPGHASMPLRTDNALVKAAEVVRRIAEYRPETRIHDIWRKFVEGMEFPPELAEPLLDADRLYDLVQDFPMIGLARQAHACTHTTFAPTVMRAGTKTNVIPDLVTLDVDIRTLPGQTGEEIDAMIQDALGDLADSVEVSATSSDLSSASPIDTPLWDALERVTGKLTDHAGLIPFLTVGATDARFFRRKGIPSYGFGLFSSRLTFDDFSSMFHGDDERVDQESLRLSTELWHALAHDVLA
ncbi:MAG TPA: M20/M25/M40 family metallo-hydrolase [Acidimicrobiales bacterium]|nr:M20/M25/M40 family metallo-hydrolase [Acidimicrobiales bacterium]